MRSDIGTLRNYPLVSRGPEPVIAWIIRRKFYIRVKWGLILRGVVLKSV